MSKYAPALFIWLLTPSLVAGVTTNFEDIPEATPASREIPPSFRSATLGSSTHLASGIKHGVGQFSEWAYNAGFSLFAANANNLFYGSLGYERRDYYFHDTPAWFDDCQRTSASLYYERVINSDWTFLALAGGALSAEEDARWKDAATGHIGLGAKYKLSKDVSISGGFMVASKLSDGPRWLPYATLNWQITPHWSLRTSAGATLSYDVFADKMLCVELTGAWHGANFRLRNATNETGSRKRALEGREGVFSLSVTKEFFKRFAYVRASVGGSFFTKYKIRSYGANIAEFETDPTLVLGIESGIRF